MVDAATWYLGPLGDMRPLICPEPGLTINQVAYTGVHQALTGARTSDFSGTKAEYEMELKSLTADEYAWLGLLNARMVPGPYYLIDPFRKNRLSVQACKMIRPIAQYPLLEYQLAYDCPSTLGAPLQSLWIKSWASYADSIPIYLDRGYTVPVTPGDVYTFSIHMKASAAASGQLCLEYVTATGAVSSTYTSSITTVTSWARNTLTRQIPAGVYGVRMYYQTAAPRTQLWFCAPQIEAGTAATDWELGGGGNTVLIDSVETTSRIFPLRDVNLKLLEA